MDGTSEPLRDGEGEPVPSYVVYCLHKGCTRTTWHGLNDWSEDEHRHMLVHTGRIGSMMGPYCDLHKEKKTEEKAA